MSQVTKFVFVIVFVFVFVFVIVFFFGQVMSRHHPDQMSQGSQISGVTLLLCFQKVTHLLSEWVSEWVSDKVTYWAVLDS